MGHLLKAFWAKLPICILLWKRGKGNLFVTLIWLNLTIKQSLIFDFSNISFIGPKMHVEHWGHHLKLFWAKVPIYVVFVETKKKKPIFMLIWLNLTIKQSLIFDFSNIPFIGPTLLLEYRRLPIEGIYSKTNNLHRFCGNEEKDTLF